MQLTAPSLTNNSRAASPVFSVVAIHDDFCASVRAREALEWLDHSLGSEFQVRASSWSFHKLERMDLRAMTLRAAAAADVIIVAADDTRPVPDQVSRWLDAALRMHQDDGAVLVALHDEDEDNTCPPVGPLCAQLKTMASRSHIHFMCNKDFDERLDRHFAFQVMGQRNEAVHYLHRPSGIDLYSSFECGGINE